MDEGRGLGGVDYRWAIIVITIIIIIEVSSLFYGSMSVITRKCEENLVEHGAKKVIEINYGIKSKSICFGFENRTKRNSVYLKNMMNDFRSESNCRESTKSANLDGTLSHFVLMQKEKK